MSSRFLAHITIKAQAIDIEKLKQEIDMIGTYMQETFEEMADEGIIAGASVDFKTKIYKGDQPEAAAATDQSEVKVPGDTMVKIHELYRLQRSVQSNPIFENDDYMRGMYNGMELILATIEDRTPVFIQNEGK